MNAKRTDLSKIQEIYDVVLQTQRQMNALGFSKEQFLQPSNDQEDLIAEGVMNRVFRVTEEAGRLSMELAERYGFDTVAIRGVRNRLAHAYGEVDREIIWTIIEREFPLLLDSCRRFCEDEGLSLD